MQFKIPEFLKSKKGPKTTPKKKVNEPVVSYPDVSEKPPVRLAHSDHSLLTNGFLTAFTARVDGVFVDSRLWKYIKAIRDTVDEIKTLVSKKTSERRTPDHKPLAVRMQETKEAVDAVESVKNAALRIEQVVKTQSKIQGAESQVVLDAVSALTESMANDISWIKSNMPTTECPDEPDTTEPAALPALSLPAPALPEPPIRTPRITASRDLAQVTSVDVKRKRVDVPLSSVEKIKWWLLGRGSGPYIARYLGVAMTAVQDIGVCKIRRNVDPHLNKPLRDVVLANRPLMTAEQLVADIEAKRPPARTGPKHRLCIEDMMVFKVMMLAGCPDKDLVEIFGIGESHKASSICGTIRRSDVFISLGNDKIQSRYNEINAKGGSHRKQMDRARRTEHEKGKNN